MYCFFSAVQERVYGYSAGDEKHFGNSFYCFVDEILSWSFHWEGVFPMQLITQYQWSAVA